MKSTLYHIPGGYSNFFFFIRRLGPSIYYSTRKYQEFQAPQKDIWNFSNPKKYPPFCTLTLRKTIKCIEMTPKYSPILWWPPKNIHKILMPQKIFIFMKTQKIMKLKFWNPKKWPKPTNVRKYQSTPPPLCVSYTSCKMWRNWAMT